MDSMAQVPLPWERLLWSARTLSLSGRYVLTDFRLVFEDGADALPNEIALHDVGEIVRSQSWFDRLARTSTLVIRRRGHSSPFVLYRVRRGAQLAALLELLTGDPRPTVDEAFVRGALRWEPRTSPRRPHYVLAGLATALALVFGVAFSLGGSAAEISYPADDAIYPSGAKRDSNEILRFMENEVLPWARTALAPIVGGAELVACSTCHGTPDRNWVMPSVAALPEPVFRRLTFERYSPAMDPQTRNAIYGYLAESDKQGKAAYMREVVMPGMARLLHRPPYDFTKPFDYNRTRFAFGCYHCHRVS
jgi:hypothetical protein